MKIEMRVLCYYFFNASDRRLLFSSVLSLVESILHRAPFLPSFFPSPPVPLGLMLNAQRYVETRDSACSP